MRNVASLSLLLLGLARVAAAQVCPPFCQFPAFINVGGTSGGVPDPTCQFIVSVRDCSNNPLPNVVVAVDFNGCTDTRICPIGLGSQVVNCGAHVVKAQTNVAGRAVFNIVGSGVNVGGSPGPGANCAMIRANDVTLGFATVVVNDQNGASAFPHPGMEVTDLTAFLVDYGTGTYYGRSDYSSLSGLDTYVLSVVDLSKFLVAFGTGYSAQGCPTTLCP